MGVKAYIGFVCEDVEGQIMPKRVPEFTHDDIVKIMTLFADGKMSPYVAASMQMRRDAFRHRFRASKAHTINSLLDYKLVKQQANQWLLDNARGPTTCSYYVALNRSECNAQKVWGTAYCAEHLELTRPRGGGLGVSGMSDVDVLTVGGV